MNSHRIKLCSLFVRFIQMWKNKPDTYALKVKSAFLFIDGYLLYKFNYFCPVLIVVSRFLYIWGCETGAMVKWGLCNCVCVCVWGLGRFISVCVWAEGVVCNLQFAI